LLLLLQGHRSAAAKWLSQELLDPNDPRNAALLELLRTRSAAANSGAGPGGVPDLFRCKPYLLLSSLT
jgi:hypothetical protein